ncbi:primase C-terminal domain-containing protein [Paenibacillus polysaccharolyticus]|uniref:primase C-terminal domain-containing protein n=1 Tax=Paenibacillus polysaccharolyticus TaxID=582692 RepID=UPI0020A04DC3|nr:primase C-terminal domain-containing protein [Paenibacillus polysaccharolyticus]MCP1137522.1 primase C-terminal domain-containing protein [Paenibacillus polysaccharolyticus]
MSIVVQSKAGQGHILRRFFRSQVQESPSRHKQSNAGRGYDFGWIYTSQDCQTYRVCRSYNTLDIHAQSNTYYTPNTFYRNDRRAQDTLRWLNAVVLDIDTKNGQNDGLILPELLERISAAGLPRPSLIVRTPSGGFHVHFILDQPRKAYANAVRQYQLLQRTIAEAIGADLQAIGAERFFRIPNDSNIIFQTDSTVSFEALNDWYWMNYAESRTSHCKGAGRADLSGRGILQHPAFQTLLRGVQVGARDRTAYTLALAFKVEGYTDDEAAAKLHAWNELLDTPLSCREIEKKVKSAYREGGKKGPKASIVTELSGIAFQYGPVWEPAKPREERKNSHFDEWAHDVITSLKALPGNEIVDSQRKLAAHWGMSLSSFQHVIRMLIDSERITVEVTGKGRTAQTVIRLVCDELEQEQMDNSSPLVSSGSKNEFFNVPSSNTLILDTVVGGAGFLVGRFVYQHRLLPGADPP